MARRTVSAIAVLTVLVLPAGASGAVLETLTVPAGATEVTTGKVVLNEGTAYTLKVSGTYEQVGKSSGQGTSYDALFCIGYINHPTGQTCSDHHRAANFAITTIAAGPWKDIDAYGGPTQRYFAGHEYTVSFEPPATGVLRAGMGIAYTHCTTCDTNSSGAITVQISGPGGGDATATKLVRSRPKCGTSSGRALLAATPRYCGFGLIGIMDTIEEIYDYEVPSAPLPPHTSKVDVVVDVQNPEDEKLFEEFVVAVVKARQRLRDQVDGCLLMGLNFQPGLALSVRGHATLLACLRIVRSEHAKQARSAAESGDPCDMQFIPAFRKGVKVSKAKVRSARARMMAGVRAKCSQPKGNQIRMQLAGRGGSLNPVLGKQVQTAVGTFGPAGAKYGDGARLLFSWGVSNTR